MCGAPSGLWLMLMSVSERVKLLGPFYIMTQIFKSAPERELQSSDTYSKVWCMSYTTVLIITILHNDYLKSTTKGG